MKRLLLAIMLILFLSLRCSAAGMEDGYYEMRYADLQVMAVTTDMFLPLGWYPEDTDAIQSDSFQAVKDLEDIVSYIESLDLPEELQGVSIEYTQFIRSLQDIYTGIEIPGDVNSPEIFNKLWEERNRIAKKATSIAREALKDEPILPEDFDYVIEQATLALDEKDMESYIKALELIDGRQCKQAYEILAKLKPKYQAKPFLPCINIRITDCYFVYGGDMKEGAYANSQELLNMLEQIVSSGKYSPVLYEAFYKWRTEYQVNNHGLSNYSLIPNKDYNKKRYKLMQVINRHISDNPDDLWAKTQLDMLTGLRNITRGGSMGNNVILDLASLYMRREDLEEKSEDSKISGDEDNLDE